MISANPSGVLNVNSSLTLNCFVAFPCEGVEVNDLTITWGGPRIDNGGPHSITQTGANEDLRFFGKLTISNVMKSDEGEYTCRAINSASLQINVLGE